MISLPEQYSFTGERPIMPEEVIELRRSSNWGTDFSEETWGDCIDQSLAVVGVRDKRGTLVGVGFLAGNMRHAVLCDFVVHPDHRNQGIGNAILERRVKIADELGIPYLYTDLVNTNPLKNKYLELGFVANSGVLARKAR